MTLPAHCTEVWLGDRCARPAGHDGLHRLNEHTWLFRDPAVPQWVERALARLLPAKVSAR